MLKHVLRHSHTLSHSPPLSPAQLAAVNISTQRECLQQTWLRSEEHLASTLYKLRTMPEVNRSPSGDCVRMCVCDGVYL